MSLTRRIQNLEVIHGPTLRACGICGGYNPMNPAYAITRHDRPLENCRECGLALDDHGRPLPPIYKRVILSPDAPEDVP